MHCVETQTDVGDLEERLCKIPWPMIHKHRVTSSAPHPLSEQTPHKCLTGFTQNREATYADFMKLPEAGVQSVSSIVG